MLEVNNLTIEINNKIIIKNLSFVINSGYKVAIIGEEGNGKSTLLKAIINNGVLTYAKISGTINNHNHTIGYLEQVLSDEYFNLTVKDFLFIDENTYYEQINSLYRLMGNLKLETEILESFMGQLSGGEKVKIQLLKILLQDPDIILLDEPTNDLDIETLEWLENYINTVKQPIIYVSHDETLLSRTANTILHLELTEKKTVPKHTFMKSNYDDYVIRRLQALKKQTQIAYKEQANYEKQVAKLKQIMNKVDHELNTISRSKPYEARLLAKKMKTLKSQEKRFTNQELTKVPDYEEAINCFFEPTNLPTQKEILKLSLDKLIIGNKVLATNINLYVRGPKHIVIIGKNGVGKTTLLKYIYQELNKRNDIKVGYMPQNYDEILKNYDTPISFLQITGDKDEISLIRQYLGNINFTRDEMTGPISNLSGGSKAKLFILKLILDKDDVLILDEPTRNISPLSNPVIRSILKNYDGAIIGVSHDRKYISEVADVVYELHSVGLIEKSNA